MMTIYRQIIMQARSQPSRGGGSLAAQKGTE